MPALRTHSIRRISPRNTLPPRALTGLLFDETASRPLIIDVPTAIPRRESENRPRFPCVEAVLHVGYPIHECSVTVQDPRGMERRFLIFAQFNSALPMNRGCRQLLRRIIWSGPILVMLQGTNVLVTSILSAHMRRLAEQALLRFLEQSEGILAVGFDLNNTLPAEIPLCCLPHVHVFLGQTSIASYIALSATSVKP
ncbi:hypothetical protein EWM64_g934 [Hericium alpestre]|uniref:Uncharacterized protein n=1 Tax=Hericium alpestre TaxID=135208 RepID=A0A4Z0A9Q0_9AGAM|nr:hypothetical protein EWM64_g934 [Hericium alpestre]